MNKKVLQIVPFLLILSLAKLFALDCKPLFVSPEQLDFGTIVTGGSKTLELHIRNDAGRFNLLQDDFFFSAGSTQADLFHLEFPPGSQESDGSVRIPVNGGTLTLKLSISDARGVVIGGVVGIDGRAINGTRHGLCNVPITGATIAPLEAPTSLGFGDVVLNSSKSLPLTIKANASLTVTSIRTGELFSISQSSIKQGILLLPVTMNTGESRTFSVTVVPTLQGRFAEALVFSTKGSSFPSFEQSIALNVTGIAPLQPDLIPEFVGTPTAQAPASGQTDAEVNFVLRVKNPGGASSACEGKVFLGQTLQKTINIEPISSGTSTQQQVTFLTGQTGNQQLKVSVDTNNANNEPNEDNNTVGPVSINIPAASTPPPPPPPPAQPDLIPEIVGSPTATPPGAGETKAKVTFQLKVSNPGGASAACEAKVLLDNNLEKTITINAIPAGSNTQQEVSFRTGQSGSHNLKVKVDTNNANTESNETNNTFGPLSINIP